jgi:putative PEP-CTERM system histidine kinase
MGMDSILNFNSLLLANLACIVALSLYVATKINTSSAAVYLIASFAPLLALQLGAYLFANWHSSTAGATLIVLATVLVPITLVPASHAIGRTKPQNRSFGWAAYYVLQTALFGFVVQQLLAGKIIEWVTGILEQPIIIIARHWRYYFLNVIGACVLALLSFDTTLKKANRAQQDELKFILVAFLGFAVYFTYLSINILLTSYVSQTLLQLGAAIVSLSLLLLAYSLAKYPLWRVNIRVSRHVIFGSLSATAAVVYLIISGTILDLLRLVQPQSMTVLLPAAAFALIALFLFVYLSPDLQNRVKCFLTRNFFSNKYDYRDLWMKFSDKSSGSLNIRELLPRVGEFVADAMFVRQVAIWLRSPTGNGYHLAYRRDGAAIKESGDVPLRLDKSSLNTDSPAISFRVPTDGHAGSPEGFPLVGKEILKELGIERVVLVDKDTEILAIIGISGSDEDRSAAEDEQFLSSVSNQLGHLILTHKLSEELLLAREWDSFNRFASFILHDLKNLATMQGMTLENAKHFGQNPEFISDALSTFRQTTEKMINLIASLSVQRGQFSLKQQPVNILQVIANTFDDLKIGQRNGVEVRTAFPPIEKLRPVSGDPELLQKAFTNLLLNAIQSLPQGQGALEVVVSNNEKHRRITASIRDTGCGISPERLETLFRPFKTTKEKGLGIGLCHTRSIIEVHGGQIRIESKVNAGTKVEVELPTV